MQNFTLHTPTEIIYGKETELQAAELVKKWGGTKVLLVYGGGSVVRSGLLAKVEKTLEEAGIAYVEFGGVQPNPRLSFAEEGVKVAKETEVDFVLAVGGGSAIDTAKAIAHGAVRSDVPLWDLFTKKEPLGDSLPIGCILTISAAGSEMSSSAVLTNEAIGKKSGLSTEKNRPKFAIMNPELTFTLPKYQIACGIADIMMHTMERYFIPNQSNQMTDEIAEALLRVVIENGRKAMENPYDYDAMSELMWCGSLSHNDLTGLGRDKDFSVHKFGHALSAKYDVAHGASLAAVWGAWAEYIYKYGIERFARFGRKVWCIDEMNDTLAAEAAIRCTVEYFKEIGLPVNLRELEIPEPTDEILMELSMDATMNGSVKLAKLKELELKDVYEIFEKAK